MGTWAYPLSAKTWSPSSYRLEAWERERIARPLRKAPGRARPEPGDLVLFFCAEGEGDDPGFYGWSVVLAFDADAALLHLRPAAPSDFLKMRPWWDDQAAELVERLRGGRGAGLQRVTPKLRDRIRDGIGDWCA